MLRRISAIFLTTALLALPACTNSSDYPTVPPPPPEGSVKPAGPGGAIPEGALKNTGGRPSPSTPKAL